MPGEWYETSAGSASFLSRTYEICPIFAGALNPVPSLFGYNPDKHTIAVLNKPALELFDPEKEEHRFSVLYKREVGEPPTSREATIAFLNDYVRSVILLNVTSHTSIDPEKHDVVVFTNRNNNIDPGSVGFLIPKQGRPVNHISRVGPTFKERLEVE